MGDGDLECIKDVFLYGDREGCVMKSRGYIFLPGCGRGFTEELLFKLDTKQE